MYGATRWTKLLRPQDTDEGYGYDEVPEAICGGGYDDHEAWRAALERYPRVNATVCSPLLGVLGPGPLSRGSRGSVDFLILADEVPPDPEPEIHRVDPESGSTLRLS